MLLICASNEAPGSHILTKFVYIKEFSKHDFYMKKSRKLIKS